MVHLHTSLLALGALLSSVRAQNSSSSSSLSSSTSGSSTTSSTSPALTSLLPVPTYTSAAPYASSSARALASSIPGYTYNLTSESNATREGICGLTTQYCATAICTVSGVNVSVNFCNPVTMGYSCACTSPATSRLQPIEVPVNSYDCRLRTSACLEQCQNPSATPPVPSISMCQTACGYDIGATCGTSDQFIPEYEVGSWGEVPKYYPDTSKGRVVPGITTSGGSLGVLRRPPGEFSLFLLVGAVVGGVLVL